MRWFKLVFVAGALGSCSPQTAECPGASTQPVFFSPEDMPKTYTAWDVAWAFTKNSIRAEKVFSAPFIATAQAANVLSVGEIADVYLSTGVMDIRAELLNLEDARKIENGRAIMIGCQSAALDEVRNIRLRQCQLIGIS